MDIIAIALIACIVSIPVYIYLKDGKTCLYCGKIQKKRKFLPACPDCSFFGKCAYDGIGTNFTFYDSDAKEIQELYDSKFISKKEYLKRMDNFVEMKKSELGIDKNFNEVK